jgi:serine/threonine-protein kinase
MVMELLSGHDLEAELRKNRILPTELAADIVVQAAAGMRDAHALGVVHRDLKPANLFLCPVPDTGRFLVKVLDFGISRVIDDSEQKMTADYTTLGTALYMSPEQVRTASHVDGRSDIWSLGIILYELLTGRPPFDGKVTDVIVKVATAVIPPPRTVTPAIPAELEAVVMRCLERNPTRRYQTMDELIDALAPWTPKGGVDALVQRLPTVQPAMLLVTDPGRRRRRTRFVTSLAVLASLGGISLVALSIHHRRERAAGESCTDESLASPAAGPASSVALARSPAAAAPAAFSPAASTSADPRPEGDEPSAARAGVTRPRTRRPHRPLHPPPPSSGAAVEPPPAPAPPPPPAPAPAPETNPRRL